MQVKKERDELSQLDFGAKGRGKKQSRLDAGQGSRSTYGNLLEDGLLCVKVNVSLQHSFFPLERSNHEKHVRSAQSFVAPCEEP